MIDTVRMIGNVDIAFDNLDNGVWVNRFQYLDLTNPVNGMLGEINEYRVKGDPLKIKYDHARKLMTVEVSIPKFLYGHNVCMINDADINRFFNKLEMVLMTKFHATVLHRAYFWKVQQMDVCWNFQVGEAAREYINAFGSIFLSRYSIRHYGNFESIEWFNNSKRMIFYDKATEVDNHKGGEEPAQLAKGILRFEANIVKTDISNYSSDRYSGDLLTERAAKYFLRNCILKLGLNEKLTASNQLNIANRLRSEYGDAKTQDLLGFILFRQLYGEDSINVPSISTYNRRMKLLSEAGIAPVFTESELPLLDISQLVA